MNDNFFFKKPNIQLHAPADLQPPPYIIEQADRNYKWRPTRSWNLSTDFFQAGTRQRSRWWLFDGRWRGRTPWLGNRRSNGQLPFWFSQKNVMYQPEMHLTLKAKKENPPSSLGWDFGNISTSFVRSNQGFTYGYVEALVKLGDSTVSSSFWLKEVPFYSPSLRRTVNRKEREIDVFEFSTSPKLLTWQNGTNFKNMFHTNLHYKPNINIQKTVKSPGWKNLNLDLSKEEFVKAGILWTRERICWYINDVLYRQEIVGQNTLANHRGHLNSLCGADAPEMHIQFDREVMGWFGEPGQDDKMETNAGDFKVFYCRTWEMEPISSVQARSTRGFRRIFRSKSLK